MMKLEIFCVATALKGAKCDLNSDAESNILICCFLELSHAKIDQKFEFPAWRCQILPSPGKLKWPSFLTPSGPSFGSTTINNPCTAPSNAD